MLVFCIVHRRLAKNVRHFHSPRAWMQLSTTFSILVLLMLWISNILTKWIYFTEKYFPPSGSRLVLKMLQATAILYPMIPFPKKKVPFWFQSWEEGKTLQAVSDWYNVGHYVKYPSTFVIAHWITFHRKYYESLKKKNMRTVLQYIPAVSNIHLNFEGMSS